MAEQLQEIRYMYVGEAVRPILQHRIEYSLRSLEEEMIARNYLEEDFEYVRWLRFIESLPDTVNY